MPRADPHFHLHTRDIDDALTRLRGLYGDAHALVGGAGFDWRAEGVDLGPMAVVRGVCSAPLHLEVSPNAHVISLSTSGVAEAGSARGRTPIVPGRSAALISPGSRLALSLVSDIQTLTVRVDPGFLAAQLEALTGAPVHEPVVFALPMRTDTGPGAFVEDFCHFLARELARTALPEDPGLRASLHECLARALLTGQPHNHSHLLERPAPPSGEAAVQLVEEYVDAHAGEPIHATDLAALTQASTRSLDAAFRAHRGTTMAAFLRERRLERARETLLGDPAASPTTVAQAAGFLRIEPFEAAYFKAFQESPTDTRRRSHATAEAPHFTADGDTFALRLASLSPRQREVCARVARGMLHKQIGAELGISERTVQLHRAQAMKKLGVGSAAELGRLFEKAGV